MDIHPSPDFDAFAETLRRKGDPARVPFYELFSDIQNDVLPRLGPPPAFLAGEPQDDDDAALRRHIHYMYALGYDYINVGVDGFSFPLAPRPTAMTTEGQRGYYCADTHTITTRQDFEAYPWPDAARADYSRFERAARLLPEGMKIIAGYSGVLENVMWLLGFEGTCLLLYDDPQLLRDTFTEVGSRLAAHFENLASLPAVGALQMGDDMGFKTQTFLAPEILRENVFPWHRKLVEAAHRHGKPIILHACGNLRAVTDDILDCGWDARHSFEDQIEPVWEAKARYGNRAAVLGGFDVDKISRMSEAQVCAHTRTLFERCAPGGGWALGTGNSVANYIPTENFLAMLEEGDRLRRG